MRPNRPNRAHGPKRLITVCLVSRHPLVLAELQEAVPGTHFSRRVWRAELSLLGAAQEAAIPRAALYVLDLQTSRPAADGLLAAVLHHFPAARLIALLEEFTDAAAFPLLRVGVKGLVSYVELRERLADAIRTVAEGGFWVPRALLSRFVDSILSSARRPVSFGSSASLSPREREVVQCLLESLSNKEIASRLRISERTVKFHVSNVLAKFSVRRRADLILLCYQSGPAST